MLEKAYEYCAWTLANVCIHMILLTASRRTTSVQSLDWADYRAKVQKNKTCAGDTMQAKRSTALLFATLAWPCWAGAQTALNISETPRNFVRAGYVHLQVNTKSGNATDVTGPIIQPSDNVLLDLLNIPALGVPANVQADIGNAGSPFGSVGRFLDKYWAVEALLGLPFKHTVTGQGTIAKLGPVATVKQLPPTIILHRYFGAPAAAFRPSLGVGLNYTRFFSARATPALEAYTGGPTEVSLKPSTGLGAFAGGMFKIDARWHVNVLLGYVDVNTTATLTTRDTTLTNTSPVLQDQPAPVPALASNPLTGPVVNGVLSAVARQRGGNLGTYERKLDLRLNPYVFAVTVGYAF
jgi:outer membrane protein